MEGGAGVVGDDGIAQDDTLTHPFTIVSSLMLLQMEGGAGVVGDDGTVQDDTLTHPSHRQFLDVTSNGGRSRGRRRL